MGVTQKNLFYENLSFFIFSIVVLSPTVFAQITIAGTITTECGEPVPAVDVLLEDLSTTPPTEYETTTSYFGTYSFDNLPSDHDWRLTPSRTTTDLCGIDGKDVADISEYLLGDDTNLTTEYARIAADADISGTLITLDMGEIQRYILGISNGFQVNWRFVDADFTFPPTPNPVNYSFPSTISYENLSQDALESDFIAIKTGDVNCSYDNSCDESDESCAVDCRIDITPSIAICPAEFSGAQLLIPVRYYAPNGIIEESYKLARFSRITMVNKVIKF